MTRRESLAFLLVAAALVTAGLVWLFGPYGLLTAGCALAVLALFVDVKEQERRGEAVAPADWP